MANDVMDHDNRLNKLEGTVTHIQGDITTMKTDLGVVSTSLSGIDKSLERLENKDDNRKAPWPVLLLATGLAASILTPLYMSVAELEQNQIESAYEQGYLKAEVENIRKDKKDESE